MGGLAEGQVLILVPRRRLHGPGRAAAPSGIHTRPGGGSGRTLEAPRARGAQAGPPGGPGRWREAGGGDSA